MEALLEKLSATLADAFEKAGYDPSYAKVTVSNRPDLCQFQCNGAMPAAKSAHKAPLLIAEDVVRALEAKGVAFAGDTLDTGVCHMAFFNDPDGNDLMLHHRYAPRA